MIQFKCSQCKELLEAPESMQGERLQCPQCRYPELVPVPEEKAESIKLEANGGNINEATQIRTFASASSLERNKAEYKRPLNADGEGATRIRTFHTRLGNNAMSFLDEQINEWVDENPDIVVKFSTSTVGMVEGKKTEPHLIISVWY
jgi:DNA-directed RNA polymerase subunit RPC12/RpoP